MTNRIHTTPKGEQREVTRLKHLFDGSRDFGFIHPKDIVVEKGFNPRDFSLPENRAQLDVLKADILAHGGVHTPISVRFDAADKSVTLVDGESRYRAVSELNSEGHEFLLPTVQAGDVGTEEERLERALSSNTGKPLAIYELGNAYKRFIKFGRSVATIAQRYSKSERFVRDAIDVAEAPQDVKIALSAGDITLAVALKAVRNAGSQAGQVIAQKVAANKASGVAGPVKAQYTKRANTVKIEVELLNRALKALEEAKHCGQYTDIVDTLKLLLPSDRTQGKAATELTDF